MLLEQQRLDALILGRQPAGAFNSPSANACTINLEEDVCLASSESDISRLINLMRSQLDVGSHVVSLDAEWELEKNAAGYQTGRGRLDLIQIGYRCADGIYRALLLKVTKLEVLPPGLRALLEDPAYTFTGRSIANDLGHIGKDFKVEAVTSQVKTIDLGPYARARGVVTRGTAGLGRLVALTLGEEMSKESSVRCGRWSSSQLSVEQQRYAAMDATYALKVYDKLSQRADLAARLSASDAAPGATADLVPRHGSVAVMATRAAAARVITPTSMWRSPFDGKPLKVTATRRMVEVTEVYAPSFVISGVKADGRSAQLSDFGAPPFQLVVPLTMLAPHVPREEVHVWPADSQPAQPQQAQQPSGPQSPSQQGTAGMAAEVDADAAAALGDWAPSEEELSLLRAAAMAVEGAADEAAAGSSLQR